VSGESRCGSGGGIWDGGERGESGEGGRPAAADPSRLRTPGDEEYWVEIDGGKFSIGRFPVTAWEYGKYLEESGGDKPERWEEQERHPSRPVRWVTWHDAMHYCEWASRKWGIGCKLATEEQWEFAARGEEGRIYPWGPEKPDEHRATSGPRA
jgi:formylglycine-generating enzyme required for sulfatase activity